MDRTTTISPADEGTSTTLALNPHKRLAGAVIISEIMESSSETIVISATVCICTISLALLIYWVIRYFKRKHQSLILPTTVYFPDYFTRPRHPVLFFNELPLNQTSDHVDLESHWQRPIQPVNTNKDFYSIVTRY